MTFGVGEDGKDVYASTPEDSMFPLFESAGVESVRTVVRARFQSCNLRLSW